MAASFFKWCRGCTREVLLVGEYAIKIPSLRSWRMFLTGLLCNEQERQFSGLGWSELCPVVFSLPGGFLVIMPRVVTLADLEPAKNPRTELTDEEFRRYTVRQDGGEVPAENKLDSFGLHQGLVKAIDYGGPGWDIWLNSPGKPWSPGAKRGWVEGQVFFPRLPTESEK